MVSQTDELPVRELTKPKKAVLYCLETACEWTRHVRGCWFARLAFRLDDRWTGTRHG